MAAVAMNRLEAALQKVVGDLRDARVRFALIGGLAVSVRAEPRFTRDIDLAVAVVDDREAESIVNDLLHRGYQILASLEQTSARRLATVRLRVPGEPVEGVVVDLLFASSGIEPELVAQAESLEIARGLEVPVACVPHLIALKLLARDETHRPQDDLDLRSLLSTASDPELADARACVALIAERGFQRDKDLPRELDRVMARFRPS